MDLKEISLEINGLLDDRRKEISLSFIEENHIYYMKDLGGKIKNDFPSVSTVLKCFYEPFDAESVSLRKARGDYGEQQKLLEQWQAAADYATNMGSRVHYELEKELIRRFGNYKEIRQPIFEIDEDQKYISNFMIQAGKEFIDTMEARGAVLLDTEIVLGDDEFGYTGQPDKVWLMETKAKDNVGIVVTDWKGLPLDTPVLTMNGWNTMGGLTEYDRVFDKDGNLVKIKHISQEKNVKCLKIRFDNGEEIISDFEHRWLVFTKYHGKKIEKIMTTQEIQDYYKNLDKRVSHKILKIENTKPINLPESKLPIDPYVFGVWLGDGHSSCGMITQANPKVWDEIIKRGYELGDDVSQGGSGKAQSRTVLGLRTKLREWNLLDNKHLPEKFLLSSYEQRLDILRGIMDSDGNYNKTRKRFNISTTKENQIKISVELISSLGLKTTVLTYNKKINNKNIKGFNIEFTTDSFNPFLCRNEDLDFKIMKDKSSYRTILSVEDVESVTTKCIEVDSPTNTFLCDRSLIVTHNTNQPKNFEVHYYTSQMFPPFEYLPDTALSHYYIQLPLYAKLLLKMLKGTKYENIPYLGGVVVLLTKEGKYIEYKVPQDVNKTILNMNIQDYLKIHS